MLITRNFEKALMVYIHLVTYYFILLIMAKGLLYQSLVKQSSKLFSRPLNFFSTNAGYSKLLQPYINLRRTVLIYLA
jgi:hypothetical protein